MHNTIEMLFVSGVTSGAGLEWVQACRSQPQDGFQTYFDPATIRGEGEMVRMWHLHDFKTKQMLADKTYLSVKNWVEYDYKNKRRRTLYMSLNSENMGAGEPIYRNGTPSDWRPVAPGSIAEILRKLACEGKHLTEAADASSSMETQLDVIHQVFQRTDATPLTT